MQVARSLFIGVALVALGACSSSVSTVSEEEAQRRLQAGLEQIAVFNYTGALELLLPVPASLPEGSEIWQQATFGLASALRYRQPVLQANVEEAKILFKRLADEATDPNLKALSMLELARLHELEDFAGDEKAVDQSRAIYQQILQAQPDTVLGAEAAIRYAMTYLKDYSNPENLEKGITLLKEYLTTYPDNQLAAVMWQTIAYTEDRYRLDAAASLAAYEEARKHGFAVPARKDNDLWIMTQLAEQIGDKEKLIALYQDVISETPRSAHGTLARQRLEKLAKEHPEKNIEIPARPTYLKVGGSLDSTTPEPTEETAPAPSSPEAQPDNS